MNTASWRTAILLWAAGFATLIAWLIWGGTTTPWLSLVLFGLSVPAFVHAFVVKRSRARGLIGVGAAGLAILLNYMLLIWAAFPEYDGPATVGGAVPAFSTVDSGGGDRDQTQLEGQRTLLFFFRGK